MGIEPMYSSFAGCRVTTSPPMLILNAKQKPTALWQWARQYQTLEVVVKPSCQN